MFKAVFPKTKFADTNTVSKQLAHLLTEAEEIKDAWIDGDWEHMAEEACDLIHSIETILHILQDKHKIDIRKKQWNVVIKNDARNYYAAEVEKDDTCYRPGK